MSNFKFAPKKGVLPNIALFMRTTSSTAAVTAANGLALAQTINKSLTDGLAVVSVAEEMAMANAATFFTKQFGKKVTITDIREGNLAELVEEANELNLNLAERLGQYQLEKKRVKLEKKLSKLERKIAALKEEQ